MGQRDTSLERVTEMFQVYNALSFITLLFYFPKLLFRKGIGDRKRYLRERLGTSGYRTADIWVHAVSVGEVLAALPFLRVLRKEFPRIQIVLSTTTPTGQKVAQDKFPEADRIMYMPWDTALCMNRPVTALRPKLFITIETELWPVLFRKLEETGSQIIILNGRLSGKSFRGYRLVKSFMESVFAPVKFFCMQGKEDVRRIVQLGADPQKVRITGNFKYDVSFDLTGSTAEWLDRAAGKILVAGSTHRGEEEIILAAYRKITGTKGKVHLILAPRHPERFSDVEEILQKEHFSYIRRTAIEESSGGSLPDVVLLDSIGELSEVYARADIAFVGGSLKPLGGHNILEPAYWGRPVLFGPHMDNFPMASDFKMAQAGIEVRDEEAIVLAVNDLLGNREKAEGMGQRAQRLVKENSGAVEKALHLVRDILGTP